MRRERFSYFAYLFLMFFLIFSGSVFGKESVVFGGGPLYTGAAANRDIIRNSGFTTVILWTIHVQSSGDLVYNDIKIVQNGAYIGKSTWGAEVHAFKEGVTSVKRIEVGIGAWGSGAFESIKNLIAAEGTGPNSTLYKNFKLLKETVPAIDGVSFDDEVTYDVVSSVQFAIMLSDLGYKVTLCPYTRSSYWSAVFSQTNAARPGTIDRVDLQCYAGGGGNNPGTWNNYFGGLKVTPGLWCFHYENGVATGTVPTSVQSKMVSWNNSYNIAGGFMWLFDDMLANQGTYPVAAYGAAINNALSIDPSDNPVVSLYQHLDYNGWSAYMGLGAYTAADIVRAGGYDNDATSLQIAPGYKVTLYDGDNFQGNVLVKYGNDSNLVDDGWNDKLSSMIIESIDGPVAHWQFNENGGSAADSSGYGFTGTLTNMDDTSRVMGRHCSGLSFDGVDDYVVVNGYNGVSDGLSRTCSAWIKSENLTGGYYNILSWGAMLNGEMWVFRVGPQGKLEVGLMGGYIAGSSWINDGRWHHVAATLADDGSATNGEIRLYVDGVFEANAYVSSTQHVISSYDVNVVIGALINSGVVTGPFRGKMDELKIYTRALNDGEIYQLYREYALPGDFTADGGIDLVDFGVLAGDWLYSGGSDTDLSCDGMVDVDDLQIFSEQWLESVAE